MIGNWLAYIYNLLPLAVRQPRVGLLISVLLSPAKTSINELTTYIADARLRSAATWQVMWLEKLLSDALGYPITIIESTGLPIDFIVSGVSYTDETLARGLLNRYKLAGKSYVLTFADVQIEGQWLNPVCARTNEALLVGYWVHPVCVKQLFTPDPDPDPDPDPITFKVILNWDSSQQGQFDGITGSVKIMRGSTQVDLKMVTQYSKGETLTFTLPGNAQGYSADFNGLDAVLEGAGLVTEIFWSEEQSMSNPQTTKETGVYSVSKTIWVNVSPGG